MLKAGKACYTCVPLLWNEIGLPRERERHVKKAIISPSLTMIDSRTSPRCKPKPSESSSLFVPTSTTFPNSHILSPATRKTPCSPTPSPSLLKTNSPAEPCRFHPAAKTLDSDTWCGNVFMFHCKFMKSWSARRPPGKGSGK